jgi:hypothetical protein
VPQETLQDPLSGMITSVVGFFTALASCSPLVIGLSFIAAVFVFARNRSRLAYLPPRIAVEGHGIKRGLTAVEAAVVLQTGLEKVLTMILFGVIRRMPPVWCGKSRSRSRRRQVRRPSFEPTRRRLSRQPKSKN